MKKMRRYWFRSILGILPLLLMSCISGPARRGSDELSLVLAPVMGGDFVFGSETSQKIDIRDDQHQLIPAALAPVYFVAIVRNELARELALYEEWNSWGYENLKFELFTEGGQRLWVTKKPGLWYRNFPGQTLLEPGQSVVIPVVFWERVWNNVDFIGTQALRSQHTHMKTIRAVYEQKPERPEPWPGEPPLPESKLWKGSVCSPAYPIGYLLPAHFFPSAEDLQYFQKMREKERAGKGSGEGRDKVNEAWY